MKKAINALVAVFATVAMAIAGFVGAGSALADGAYSITAPANGHTYEAYQVFTGDLSEKGVLSNLQYGSNATQTGKVAENVAENLAAAQGDEAVLKIVKQHVTLAGTPAATIHSGETVTVAAGYYLIKDKDDSVSGTDSYTTYIMQVVGNVTIKPKSSVPTFKKKIKDTNDTDGKVTDWRDSADYDFGDEVPFKLEGTVAENYDSYKTYYFAFHDQEETGLTFKQITSVTVDGQVVNPSLYAVSQPAADGDSFDVVFSDLKKTGAHAGSKVVVEYTSTLNEGAKLGSQGNVNKAKLEFSNNPNEEQQGSTKPSTGETPWDNVIVFTYKVVVNKVNEKEEDLKGAAFKLEKKQSDGTYQTVKDFTSDVTESNKPTSFEFNGLDDGEYKLSETKTPAGYNTIQPITFTVTADHTLIWNGENRDTVLTKLSGNAVSGEIIFTDDKSAGSLTTNVVNKPGSSLPETGGMGTIVLYVAGAALVVAAGAYFTLKKKYTR